MERPEEKRERVAPIAGVTPVWSDRNCDKYPSVVRIAMEDGTVQDYAHVIEQPHPNFVEAMEALERMFDCIGYKAPAAPAKKRRRRP